MKKTGFLVWINDEQFWHTTLSSAQKRADRAARGGDDTLIVGFEIRPYIINPKSVSRAA
jgi:hypothetical protein